MWERIIDRLRDEPRVLKACQLVCKKWQTRSRFWLDQFRPPVLCNTHDVRQWTSWVYEMPRYRGKVDRAEIFGDRDSLGRPLAQGVFPDGGLAHMGTFAAMLGGLLPCLREIHIESGDWSASMPHTIYLHLQVFTSVTVLSLSGAVRFPSVGAFCRLINALNGLQSLLTDAEDTVHFTDHTIREQAPKRLLPPNPSRIKIGGPERRFTEDRRAAEDFNQVVSTMLPTACRHLELRCISLGCVQSLSIQRLLRSAGRALHSLTITPPALDNDLPAVTDTMLPEAARILATTGVLELVGMSLSDIVIHLCINYDTQTEL
ncbi:hypothetical protein WOLCODRAFT_153382 [Wolfiporia cocos MD-104 SS10]|uniref:F-box domain-containing protein n=1 Tax=Wolfiporia cocos (strain MD-104) TaxID=742152 RepID=A0A2H3JZL6_WOLCO|nr:hypothetical protein WOLCODRAFT_153382 [Wolfiporia cocos MD-104 SS10]